jgi:hypothetical protein
VKIVNYAFLRSVVLGLLLAAPGFAGAQAIALRNVTVSDGTISGDLVNTTQHPVRDVRLLVRQTWLWAQERTPGDEGPSRAEYSTVQEKIAAGGSLAFIVRPSPPLPLRSDGRFETSAVVVGYTEASN